MISPREDSPAASPRNVSPGLIRRLVTLLRRDGGLVGEEFNRADGFLPCLCDGAGPKREDRPVKTVVRVE